MILNVNNVNPVGIVYQAVDTTDLLVQAKPLTLHQTTTKEDWRIEEKNRRMSHCCQVYCEGSTGLHHSPDQIPNIKTTSPGLNMPKIQVPLDICWKIKRRELFPKFPLLLCACSLRSRAKTPCKKEPLKNPSCQMFPTLLKNVFDMFPRGRHTRRHRQ